MTYLMGLPYEIVVSIGYRFQNPRSGSLNSGVLLGSYRAHACVLDAQSEFIIISGSQKYSFQQSVK